MVDSFILNHFQPTDAENWKFVIVKDEQAQYRKQVYKRLAMNRNAMELRAKFDDDQKLQEEFKSLRDSISADFTDFRSLDADFETLSHLLLINSPPFLPPSIQAFANSGLSANFNRSKSISKNNILDRLKALALETVISSQKTEATSQQTCPKLKNWQNFGFPDPGASSRVECGIHNGNLPSAICDVGESISGTESGSPAEFEFNQNAVGSASNPIELGKSNKQVEHECSLCKGDCNGTKHQALVIHMLTVHGLCALEQCRCTLPKFRYDCTVFASDRECTDTMQLTYAELAVKYSEISFFNPN